MVTLEVIFFVSVLLLAYTYVGYPLLIRVLASLLRRPAASPDGAKVDEPFEPRVSIVVVAHNEAHRISERIENLLSLDYPAQRMEIAIASDASSDETVERARRYEDRGVKVVEFTEHRGKPAVLNEMIPRLSGDVVVLMDVRQRVETAAVRELVKNFRDPRIGAVSGELILTRSGIDSDVGEGVGFYWKYEKFIRANESRLDSTVGATGAIYAIRHELFRPIPPETILDDVLIPMQVVRSGYRVIFEAAARAYDRVSPTAQGELTRKTRTIAGNFQLFCRQPWLLNPRVNRLWFQTVSHKLLRLCGPLLLVAAFTSNLLLASTLGYQILMGLQLAFYAAALAGHLLPNTAGKSPVISVAHAFCLLNYATVLGFIRFVSGRQRVTWTKAPDTVATSIDPLQQIRTLELLKQELASLQPGDLPDEDEARIDIADLGSRRRTMQQLSRRAMNDQSSMDSEVRPWGGWSVLNEGPGYKVKLIAVSPGHRLSLQYHQHRSEHWIVVAGKARAIVGKQVLDLGILQSADIPAGTIHRIENPYSETLIVVEVQEGSTLLEDDIVRLEDDYQQAHLIRSIAT